MLSKRNLREEMIFYDNENRKHTRWTCWPHVRWHRLRGSTRRNTFSTMAHLSPADLCAPPCFGWCTCACNVLVKSSNVSTTAPHWWRPLFPKNKRVHLSRRAAFTRCLHLERSEFELCKRKTHTSSHPNRIGCYLTDWMPKNDIRQGAREAFRHRCPTG